jgi:hypothetical protein
MLNQAVTAPVQKAPYTITIENLLQLIFLGFPFIPGGCFIL